MNRLKFSIVILFSTICTMLSATNYSVSGCVVTEKDEPVEFSTIVFLNNGIQSSGTTTDAGGCFSTEMPKGRYEIKISYVGLKTYSDTIEVNKNIDLGKVILSSGSVVMKELTVTASPIRREADRFIMQLEGQPITIGKNGEEILKQAPGVWISNDDKISINGNSGTRIYINDREQTMSNEQLLNFLRGLSAEDVSKIEVIPRAGAEYSADSQGGIIKITLKKNKDNGIMGNIGANADFASDRTAYSPHGNINFKSGKLSINGGAWLYHLPKLGFETTENTSYFSSNSQLSASSKQNRDKCLYAGGNLGAIYDLNDKNSIGAEVQYSMNDEKTKLSTVSNMLNANLLTSTKSDYITNGDGYNWNAKFNYIHKLDTLGSTLKFLVNYTYSKATSNDDNKSSIITGSLSQDSIFRNSTKVKYNVLNGGLDLNKVFSKKWSLIAGVKYTLNDTYNYAYYDYLKGEVWHPSTNFNYDINYTENIYALYAIGSFNSGRWQVKAGLRGEYTNTIGSGDFVTKNYFDLFPQANVNYLLTEKGDYSIGLGYDRKISRPSFWDLSPIRQQISDYSFQTGNPNLNASYQDNISFNMSFAYKYSLSAGFSFSNDEINQQMRVDETDPRYMILTAVNETKIRNLYISAYAPVQITKWLSVTANVTYAMRSELKANTDNSFKTNHLLFANGSIDVTLPYKFYISSNVYYSKAMTMGNISMSSRVWCGVDLKKKFADDKWVASIGVGDIFATDFKITGTGPDFNREFTMKRYPSFKCSLTYNFNSGKKFQARTVESNEDVSRMQNSSK
ncbi:MAG: outer membrane beta-barrel family protein [Muribaculaceae bacterium]|nr:outer membrane beta-barrel family protein [Muribaculaceae bacterium]